MRIGLLCLLLACSASEVGSRRPARAEVPVRQQASAGSPTAPDAELVDAARYRVKAAELSAFVERAGGMLGLAIGGALDSRPTYELNGGQPLNPASLTKLVTAAVAFARLGPSHRFKTLLSGDHFVPRPGGGVWVAKLVLRGGGDPSLRESDLWRLARSLRERGVTEVGDVYVDQSRFDAEFVPPAFEQQPNEWSAFRAPVSPLALERNAVTLHVAPTGPGEPARAWFEPSIVTETLGAIATGDKRAKSSANFALSATANGLRAELSGQIAANASPLELVKRVEDPRLLPGFALKALLTRLGIKVSGDVRLGAPRTPLELESIESPPLSVLMHELGKHSDNFYAEMIFKALAIEGQAGGASSQRAAQLARDWLSALSAFPVGSKLINGSGLFDANRLAARSVLRVLQASYADESVRHEYLSQLAIGGVDGTLQARFPGHGGTRIIRGKTGTLQRVDALAGYVLSGASRPPLAFVLIVNGIADQHAAVRAKLDEFVETLVAP